MPPISKQDEDYLVKKLIEMCSYQERKGGQKKKLKLLSSTLRKQHELIKHECKKFPSSLIMDSLSQC